jgi:hypothetical protein
VDATLTKLWRETKLLFVSGYSTLQTCLLYTVEPNSLQASGMYLLIHQSTSGM